MRASYLQQTVLVAKYCAALQLLLLMGRILSGQIANDLNTKEGIAPMRQYLHPHKLHRSAKPAQAHPLALLQTMRMQVAA